MPSESASAEYLCQIVKLHPLQEILRTELVLGDDTVHPANHNWVIALQPMLIRKDWGLGLACMEHGAPVAQIVNSPSGVVGNERGWGRAGAHWICSLRHSILWRKRVHSRHLRISSPRDNRIMESPQASPTHCDIGHCSAICWSGLSSTLFTPEAGIWLQRARDTTASLADPTRTATTSEEHPALGQIPWPWFCPCWPEVPFLLC